MGVGQGILAKQSLSEHLQPILVAIMAADEKVFGNRVLALRKQ
jgi:hypothetical protein